MKKTFSKFHDQFGVEAFDYNWRNRVATHSLNIANDLRHFGKDYPVAFLDHWIRQNAILVCKDSSFFQTILLSYI